jgi:hypothetical protein
MKLDLIKTYCTTHPPSKWTMPSSTNQNKD